jgi:hypothetical protein
MVALAGKAATLRRLKMARKITKKELEIHKRVEKKLEAEAEAFRQKRLEARDAANAPWRTPAKQDT